MRGRVAGRKKEVSDRAQDGRRRGGRRRDAPEVWSALGGEEAVEDGAEGVGVADEGAELF